MVLVGLLNSAMFPGHLPTGNPQAWPVYAGDFQPSNLQRSQGSGHPICRKAFLLPALCYMYIPFYAFREAQVRLSLPEQV